MSVSPDVVRVAAFCDGGEGGNPAGVRVMGKGEGFPTEAEMLAEAAAVGYAETAYLVHHDEEGAATPPTAFKIRFFAPEMEIAFCGHATIASAAVLGKRFGAGNYSLHLISGDVLSVAATADMSASFVSPKMWTRDAPEDVTEEYLSVFNISEEELEEGYPIQVVGTTISHFAVFVKEQGFLEKAEYNFDAAKLLMLRDDIKTVSMLHRRDDGVFLSRNFFPPGGVYEDPATGSAAAALAGYLRDIKHIKDDHNTAVVLQGHYMTPSQPSRIEVSWTPETGVGATLKGNARNIE